MGNKNRMEVKSVPCYLLLSSITVFSAVRNFIQMLKDGQKLQFLEAKTYFWARRIAFAFSVDCVPHL